jgi:4'-phosphopantetheinyl transferase
MNVHWFEQTEADVPVGQEWLTHPEALRLSALAIPKRRADWRLGRWTAKQALRGFLDGRPPQEIEIRAGSTGAPEVWIAGQRQALTISISHRDARACCAVAEVPAALGCDLEANEPHTPGFISDYFTEAEQHWIRQAAAEGVDEVPALLWSAKESALKALGVGLREDTRSVAVQESSFSSWPFLADWRRLHVRYGTCDLHGWWRADREFIRTLVADPPPHAPVIYPAGDAASRNDSDRSSVYAVV